MNNGVKQFFRVLGVIASVLLSIVLVVTLIVVPMYSVTKSLVKPENITKIIQDVDYVELLLGQPQVGETIDEVLEQNPELKEELETYVEPIIQSPIVEDIVTMYAEDVTGIINGELTEYSLNKETLSALVDEHMDTVVGMIQEKVPEGSDVTEEAIREKVSATVETYGDAIIEAMPAPEEIQTMIGGVKEQPVIALAIDSSVPYILYGFIAVLAVLIFFCLYGRARGLLCLGIDALVASLFLFAISFLLGENGLIGGMIGSDPQISSLLSPAIGLLSSKTLLGAIIVIVSGVVLIAGYVAWNVYKNKAAKADDAQLTMTDIT